MVVLYRNGLAWSVGFLLDVGMGEGCGLVWFGLVWFGLVWFGLVWFGLVRFGLFRGGGDNVGMKEEFFGGCGAGCGNEYCHVRVVLYGLYLAKSCFVCVSIRRCLQQDGCSLNTAS